MRSFVELKLPRHFAKRLATKAVDKALGFPVLGNSLGLRA